MNNIFFLIVVGNSINYILVIYVIVGCFTWKFMRFWVCSVAGAKLNFWNLCKIHLLFWNYFFEGWFLLYIYYVCPCFKWKVIIHLYKMQLGADRFWDVTSKYISVKISQNLICECLLNVISFCFVKEPKPLLFDLCM